MGFDGLVFVAIALAWLIYLVPLFLHRNTNGLFEEAEPDEPITPSVTIVRRGVPLDVAEEETLLVSTPLNRRAALRELDLTAKRAAVRRRVVLGVLLAAATASGVLAGLRVVPWWTIAAPAVLIVAFVGIARVTVVRMQAQLDARADRIRLLGQSEQTVAIEVLKDAADAGHEQTVELGPPAQAKPSLWDPIPVTRPTYVSKPLAPRTVRTIDLSAPLPVANGGIPVTADAPEPPAAAGPDLRAVNE